MIENGVNLYKKGNKDKSYPFLPITKVSQLPITI